MPYIKRGLLRSELKDLRVKFGDDFKKCIKPLMMLCPKGQPVKVEVFKLGSKFSHISFKGHVFKLNNNYISKTRC